MLDINKTYEKAEPPNGGDIQARLEQALMIYKRTLDQDPTNTNLPFLRGEIIKLNPYQEFVIDPETKIYLPEVYTSAVKSHISALRRTANYENLNLGIEETLPDTPTAEIALETLETQTSEQRLQNLKTSKPENTDYRVTKSTRLN